MHVRHNNNRLTKLIAMQSDRSHGRSASVIQHYSQVDFKPPVSRIFHQSVTFVYVIDGAKGERSLEGNRPLRTVVRPDPEICTNPMRDALCKRKRGAWQRQWYTGCSWQDSIIVNNFCMFL